MIDKAHAPARKALEGLVVLDIGQNISGPYCTKLLGSFGAEVIKIEQPGGGDPSRKVGPFPNDTPHPERSALFLYLNTNKKSITLDLGSETGANLFKILAAGADVLVENFMPGKMTGLGLGPGTPRRDLRSAPTANHFEDRYCRASRSACRSDRFFPDSCP